MGKPNAAAAIDPNLINNSGVRIADRFMSHVKILPDGCWLWMGSRRGPSHGQFGVNFKDVPPATRASWRMFRGAIPKNHYLRTCIRYGGLCVNTDHMRCVPAQPHRSMLRIALRTFTREEIAAMREEYAPRGLTLSQLGDMFGVTREAIRLVTIGKLAGSETGRLTPMAVAFIKENYRRGTIVRERANYYGITSGVYEAIVTATEEDIAEELQGCVDGVANEPQDEIISAGEKHEGDDGRLCQAF
jgi:hypothetical protein